MCRGGGWNEERERERGMKRDGAACTWVSGVKRAAHRRGTTPRLVRGRRDRCPWDARAFLVREAHETNGRRASPDHAFPREKKLRCVYPWLAFRLSRPSTSPSSLSSSSSPRSPIHEGRREGGWKGELHVGGNKSIFALYAASNADKFLPRGEKERKPRSPFVSSSHEIARGSRGASTLDLFPLKFGSLKGVEKESALAREASRALSRGSGSGFHGINDFQGEVSVEIKL